MSKYQPANDRPWVVWQRPMRFTSERPTLVYLGATNSVYNYGIDLTIQDDLRKLILNLVTTANIETITKPDRDDTSEPHGPIGNNINNTYGSQSSTTPSTESARPFVDRMFHTFNFSEISFPEDVRPLQKEGLIGEERKGNRLY
ncbi:hypothetical protein J6590_050822 [Homalodisca vitripennis]|nr:hypothetical protein J6590_050822 [Homalodisca vitripennis]